MERMDRFMIVEGGVEEIELGLGWFGGIPWG